jgi:uncharacterized membrane protein YeaQ/YmgE (transglycosylase-associated protein family)
MKRRGFQLLDDIVIGVIGMVLGGFVFSFLGISLGGNPLILNSKSGCCYRNYQKDVIT